MKIGIDISQLNYEGTGVGNFTYNLVRNLLLANKNNEYRLFYASLHKLNNPILSEFEKLGAKVYRYPFPHKALHFLWGDKNLVPIDLLIGKVDVMIFSDYLRPPTLYKTRGITIIHDLIWKLFPDKQDQKTIKYHEIKIKKTIENGDVVITDSECTKNDLIKLFPQIDEKKIQVIYPGIGDQFKLINQNIGENIIKKYYPEYSILNTKYLLYVGAIEPRKNLDITIKTFHQLITHHPSLITEFFIAGKAGWEKDKIYELVKSLNLEDKVKFIGFVPDSDLPYLYSGAKALVYLSTYEGFGLPPLEAASCGTPVLLYNNSSLSELFKNGYPYTKKGEEINALKFLLENKIDTKKYLNQFSWKEYIARLINIFGN